VDTSTAHPVHGPNARQAGAECLGPIQNHQSQTGRRPTGETLALAITAGLDTTAAMTARPVQKMTLMQTSRWFGLVMLCFAAGCATKKPAEFLFFPPAPDEPRIQFLTSFSNEKEMGGQGKLSEFVVGSDRILRPIVKPYGVTVKPGMVYVCDTGPHNVVMADLVKHRIRYLKPEGPGALVFPVNVAVDDDGTRYITDTQRGQVLMFAGDDRFLGALGKKGEMKPCGIALAGDRLYVTDLSNRCVRVYGKANRDLLFTVPRNPADPKSKLFQPTNVAVDQQGRIYVSDTGGYVGQIYDAQGNHVRAIGEQGLEPGRFVLPKGIGVDRQSQIYVVDAATAVVQMFDAEGRLLMYFGEPKASGRGALYLPAGLAIDYSNVNLFQKYVAPGFTLDHLIFVINQAGTQKVNVYGFVRKR
jgi:DNA-binding beta-propeller fold protein YncE